MLHEFITENRALILDRARAKVSARLAPQATSEELELGVPRFLDELVAILREGPEHAGDIDSVATLHGERRQQMGFTVAQVVEDYGDLCQVVTQLAIEMRAPIDTEEFKTLNRCLDAAIGHAVTEYARARERAISEDEVERLGFFAHELRNHLQAASLAYDILRSGTVGIGGSTGAVLGRSLAGLQALVDRTLAQVRLDTERSRPTDVGIAVFLEEVEAAGSILAKERGVSLAVERGDGSVVVEADRQLLGSAVSNLVQNAIKFTAPGGHVMLRTSATAGHVSIEVADECGGLRAGQAELLFDGLPPAGSDRSGLGLGLQICKVAVESMHGSVRVRNRPGVGCVFTIELPRRPA